MHFFTLFQKLIQFVTFTLFHSVESLILEIMFDFPLCADVLKKFTGKNFPAQTDRAFIQIFVLQGEPTKNFPNKSRQTQLWLHNDHNIAAIIKVTRDSNILLSLVDIHIILQV